ncbi:olfactory receptor 1020-like [Rana temporaria]|uniref:olfactory receptor 1020-like n=1 Tax=Rana temporaria TaxID=8407 RepID=UPI001AADF328|nr:olfactory receptor 1020-like [Rana temporaria]
MEDINETSVKFILIGLSSDPDLQVVYFLTILVVYLITLLGNLLLISVVQINPKLHTPMYFFLSNLSVIDLCFSSSIIPTLLINTLSKDTSISLHGCAAQMFFSLVLGATECFLLALMAYDRFAAICKPLHYNSIMNKNLCSGLALSAWSGAVVNATIHVVLTFQLPFCRSHHVNHFFCEMPPLLRLSCKDTRLNELVVYVSAAILCVCAFLLILISYVRIITTILKISSSQGRRKAFSTCTSHLTVVTFFYGTIMFIYLRPRSSFSETDKAVSIVYTAITPMLNPIIYSIRNKDVKSSIVKYILRRSNFINKC